jgi:CubicO group peptidase (beta-lactamase class C family)
MQFHEFKTKIAAIVFHALALCIAQSEALAQSSSIVWPTQQWLVSTPESQGMDSAALATLVDYGASNEMDSLVITRFGKIVTEVYFAPFKPTMRHRLNSVTKGVVSTLTGIAISQGLLKSADEQMLRFFPSQPDANPDARRQTITISHLLDMTSGIEWIEPFSNVLPESLFAMQNNKNWVQFVLNRPMANAPGERFNYNSGNSQLLAAILTMQSGMTLSDFASKQLFEPLGILNSDWRRDPQGINTGGLGLYLTTRDMAKIGYLYLRGGEWDSKQIVPRAWIDKVFKASIPMNISDKTDWRYGSAWWTLPARKAYLAVGFNRQLILVMPEAGVVVAATGRKNYSIETLIDLVGDSVKSEVPLPTNPSGSATLAKRLTDSATLAPSVPTTLGFAQTLSGKTYLLDSNNLGLKELTLHFDGNGSYDLVRYVARGSDETRKITQPLGLNGGYTANNPDNGRDIFSKSVWVNANSLKIDTRRPEEGEAVTYILEFMDKRVVINYTNEFRLRVQLNGTMLD